MRELARQTKLMLIGTNDWRNRISWWFEKNHSGEIVDAPLMLLLGVRLDWAEFNWINRVYLNCFCLHNKGFAARELSVRIRHVQPKVIISASCGVEPSRVIKYAANQPIISDIDHHFCLPGPEVWTWLKPCLDFGPWLGNRWSLFQNLWKLTCGTLASAIISRISRE